MVKYNILENNNTASKIQDLLITPMILLDLSFTKCNALVH